MRAHLVLGLTRRPPIGFYAALSWWLDDMVKWYSHQELNLDQRFRKPLLYPFELWEPLVAPGGRPRVRSVARRGRFVT